jgi:hypothetical protein
MTTNASSTAVSPTVNHERGICYSCLRELTPDEMSGCMACGELLCLDYPTCAGKCRCEEEENLDEEEDGGLPV